MLLVVAGQFAHLGLDLILAVERNPPQEVIMHSGALSIAGIAPTISSLAR